MMKICIADAIALLEPIKNDPIAIAMIDESYSITVDEETCELKRCKSRSIEMTKSMIELLKTL